LSCPVSLSSIICQRPASRLLAFFARDKPCRSIVTVIERRQRAPLAVNGYYRTKGTVEMTFLGVTAFIVVEFLSQLNKEFASGFDDHSPRVETLRYRLVSPSRSKRHISAFDVHVWLPLKVVVREYTRPNVVVDQVCTREKMVARGGIRII
jgi:hypothetical protein